MGATGDTLESVHIGKQDRVRLLAAHHRSIAMVEVTPHHLFKSIMTTLSGSSVIVFGRWRHVSVEGGKEPLAGPVHRLAPVLEGFSGARDGERLDDLDQPFLGRGEFTRNGVGYLEQCSCLVSGQSSVDPGVVGGTGIP
jgi:hypothetical protein